MRQPDPASPYELFSLALSVVALVVLSLTVSGTQTPETRHLLELADLTLCGFFFLDFCRNLAVADRRLRYLYTWGWLDLAASIPAVDALRPHGRCGIDGGGSWPLRYTLRYGGVVVY